MEAKHSQALVDQLSALTKEQRDALIAAVKTRASATDAIRNFDLAGELPREIMRKMAKRRRNRPSRRSSGRYRRF